MKVTVVGMLLSIFILAGVSIDAIAKHAAVPVEEQNGAVIIGLAGESYPL